MPHRESPPNRSDEGPPYRMVQLALPSAWCTFNTKSRLLFHVQSLPFAFAQQRQLGFPYLDRAVISAILFLEVTTASHGSQIADRQIADNAVPTLTRGFTLKKTSHRHRILQRKIWLLAVAHDTSRIWIKAWFYTF